MSFAGSAFANVPGMGSPVEEFQSAFTWGPAWMFQWQPGLIAAAAVDSGNSPTTTLRMGLIMGKITASGLWTNYSASATDGSQVAQGILAVGVRMTDVITGSTQQKFWAIMVAGAIKAANLINLDGQARVSLARQFLFDDDLGGRAFYPGYGKGFLAKATDYTVTANDNGTLFTTTGATGAVIFTLPTLAAGLSFGFYNTVNQNMTITSAAGNDIFALNDTAASSVAFSTGGQKVGASARVYSNPAGTAWHFVNESSGFTATVT